MIGFACHVCRTALTAEDSQAGKLLRCPTCLTTLRAPLPADIDAVARSSAMPIPAPPPAPSASGESETANDPERSATTSTIAPTTPVRPAPPLPRPPQQTPVASQLPQGFSDPAGSRRYGFNCAYCSSRLEATGAMAGHEGTCPTCGNTIVIPILDRHGRLIDPITRQIIKQDPHPVHAYAAAGDRAPAILRNGEGQHLIRCPRCQVTSPIVANNCKACGMPFTMEGTTQEAAGNGNGFCTASLVLGVIGLVAFLTIVPPVLAVIFGIIGYNQVTRSGVEGMKGGKKLALAGIICGGIGCLFAFGFILSKS